MGIYRDNGIPSRREYTRYKIDAPVTVCLKDRIETLTLQDISARGMCAVGSVPLDVNNDVEISFVPPAVINPMTKKACVLWCRDGEDNMYKIGFSLSHLDLDNFVPKLDYGTAFNTSQPAIAIAVSEPKESLATAIAASRDRSTYGFLKAAFVVGALLAVLFYVFNKSFFAPVSKAVIKGYALANKDVYFLKKDIILNLEGIMHSAIGKSFAIINGRVLTEGQSIQNMTVKKITKDSVVLITQNNQERVLFIK